MTSLSAAKLPNPQDYKTQFGLALHPQDGELVVAFFCGGGAGTGLEMGLGRKVDVAKNHSAVSPPPMAALAKANNPCKYCIQHDDQPARQAA